ncbi:uncharacterized protein [Asterias amurensis]|uniref:uncharacterized protein n=1 Tax=Asterias amurensis TaxID=7602 RepID=UPI003AB1AE32
MGLPDGQEVYHPHRLRSQSSDDSMLLSCGGSPGRSLELESIATGSSSSCSSSSRSSQHNDTTSSSNQRQNRPSAGQSQCNRCTMHHKPKELPVEDLRNHAVRCPDNIKWKAGAKKVTITRIGGKIGFKYRVVRGATNTNQWYTMVNRVDDGPSAGRINIGDWILSANGQPIQISQKIDLKSIIDANKSDPVTLMIQSPERRLIPKSSCANCTPHSESQAKYKSREAYTNLNTLMPRLPEMRVLISGSEAEQIATSLLQGATPLRPSTTEVGVLYQAFVSKKNSLFSMYTKSVEQKERINSKPVDEVELEVIALKDTPFPAYCHHVLATAHSIFIVQFSGRAFINNRHAVLTSIQQRLNKIRTYATNRVPIYLVMTSEGTALPAEQLAEISQSLNLQFYQGFKNQLQYNAATDYPLFTATVEGEGDLKNLPSPFGNLGRQISREDNSDTGQSHVLYSRNNTSLDVCYYAKSTELINSQGSMYHIRELREHLSKSAFQQDFIAKSYPRSFMLHRKRLKEQGMNGLHYQPKAWIMTVCDGNLDPNHLLRFLHDNGDIVCSDYLEYSISNSDMILLDRDYLITLTKRLTTIPTRSEQQDPHLNDAIKHWDDLTQKATASSMFLKYLFRNHLENPNILTTLLQMNLIHRLEPSPSNNSPSETSYVVPFFLPADKKTPGTQAYNHHDPRLYNLCVDFQGSIPDGFFLTGLVELIKTAMKTNGSWSIDSATSAHLSLGVDCELDIHCDEVQSVINISARCSASYQHRNLPHLLTKIFDPLQAVQSDLRITIGPPCPLYQEQCKTRMQVPWKAHVIDLAGGRAGTLLRCGDLRVNEYPSVNRWLYRAADRMPTSMWNADKVPVSKRTHIFQLPPGMVHWICDKLNPPPVRRNWQGLAGVLGYTYSEVTVFANRRQSDYDPCNALLLDWGRFANSTLESLINHLTCHTMGRMDISTMLYEKWEIVE